MSVARERDLHGEKIGEAKEWNMGLVKHIIGISRLRDLWPGMAGSHGVQATPGIALISPPHRSVANLNTGTYSRLK